MKTNNVQSKNEQRLAQNNCQLNGQKCDWLTKPENDACQSTYDLGWKSQDGSKFDKILAQNDRTREKHHPRCRCDLGPCCHFDEPKCRCDNPCRLDRCPMIDPVGPRRKL